MRNYRKISLASQGKRRVILGASAADPSKINICVSSVSEPLLQQ